VAASPEAAAPPGSIRAIPRRTKSRSEPPTFDQLHLALTGPALDLAAAALRTRIDDYECHRLVVTDPILGSAISMRWRLPTRA
jgi:hypothetical protein